MEKLIAIVLLKYVNANTILYLGNTPCVPN